MGYWTVFSTQSIIQSSCQMSILQMGRLRLRVLAVACRKNIAWIQSSLLPDAACPLLHVLAHHSELSGENIIICHVKT